MTVDAQPISIVLVEDDEDDYILTRDLLDEIELGRFELNWISTYEEALQVIRHVGADVYLVDYRLGQQNGLDLLREALSQGVRAPIIVLTGQGNREIDLEAMQAGAADYLIKGEINSYLLERAIRYAVERRQAEDKLRESQERYRGIVEDQTELVCRFLPDRTLTFVNRAYCRYFDFPEEQLIGRAFTAFVLDDDRPIVERALTGCRPALPLIPYYEHRVVLPDGDVRWQQWTGRAIFDPSGNLVEIQAVGRDVTERIRAEEALREGERRMQALVVSLDDIVFEFDEQGTYLNVWTADEKLLSHPKAELLGRRMDELLGEERARPFLDPIRRVLASGHPENIEYPLDVIGGQRWFLARISPILSDDGAYHTVCMLVRDVTERKQAEEEIRRRAAQQAALNAIIGAASQAEANLEDLLEVSLGHTLRAFGLEKGSIWLDPSEHITRGLLPEFAAAMTQTAQARGVVVSGPSATPDWQQVPGDGPAAALAQVMARFGVRADLVVPLWRDGQRVGGLSIMASEPRQWSADDIALLEAIGRQLGIVAERARLFDETRRRLEHLQALRAIDTAITSSLDLGLTLNVFLDQVLSQLHVDAASVLLYEPSTQRLTYTVGRGFRTRAIEDTSLRLGHGHVGQAALERRLVQIPDLAESPSGPAFAAFREQEGFVSYFNAPLIAKSQIVGVLEVFHRARLEVDKEWLGFLETLAGQAAIAVDSARLFDDLQRSNLELQLAYDTTLEGWSRALDLRDKETEGHTRRVTAMTVRLARAAGIGEVEINQVQRGALLHDIGKMGIPDSILLKPGPLTEDEWVIMRKHPVYAYELLYPIAYLRPALDIPYCHHEKWDGTGYPRRLKGEQIPVAARLFAVADVWDALRSDRPYRPAWPPEKVLAHIQSLAGTHFDPRAVDVFLQVMGDERGVA